MSRKTVLTISAPLLAGLVLVIAYAFASPLPDPAPYQSPVGTIIVCNAVVSGTASGAVNLKFENLAGPARFRHAAHNQPVSTAFTSLELVDLSHCLPTEHYGEICVTGDALRPLASSIQAHTPLAPFPATSTRKFHVSLTVGSIQGVTFTSVDPVYFEDLNLTEWPQNGAVYNQVGVATFERSDRPGVIALTISDATLTLTGPI